MAGSVDALKGWVAARLTWFGQSAFRIRSESGTTILIDPWRVPASAGPADIILVTHPHGDHYDRKAIAGLSREGTAVILPRSCAGSGQNAIAAGETFSAAGVRITAVAAYNQTKRFHPKGSNWVGYVVEIDGLRVYHAGDTDVIAEMRDLRPDIALLPIGGLFAMDWRAGVEAARLLKAGLAVPMHFNWLLGGRSAGCRFACRINSDARGAADSCSAAMVLPRG